MDDCPTSFKSRLPLLPSFWPSALDWTYVDPLFDMLLSFDEDMDQTIFPLPAEFILTIDDIEQTISAVTWDDATTLSVEYSEAVLNPIVASLRYPTSSPRFLSVLGELVTPFDLPSTEV